jgi:hypothetical protein
LGDETDLGVSLTFLEVVVTDLESLQVIPLGVGIDDVLFQLDVGKGAVAVVGVDYIAVGPNNEARRAGVCRCAAMRAINKCVASASRNSVVKIEVSPTLFLESIMPLLLILIRSVGEARPIRSSGEH